MTREQQIAFLIKTLEAAVPDARPPAAANRRSHLRALMNLCPPIPFNESFFKVQDDLLLSEREEKVVIDAASLPGTPLHPMVSLWRGDITAIRADAIVNAANSRMLGCFVPCHGCIDNAIYSAAGHGLRLECAQQMTAQGHSEPVGTARITGAYNLPCRHVIHTVGPALCRAPTKEDCAQLESCYCSCLALAVRHGLKSIVFCCISTGEFRFPPQPAAQIAVDTVMRFLTEQKTRIKVIFDVFTDRDEAIYRGLLAAD